MDTVGKGVNTKCKRRQCVYDGVTRLHVHDDEEVIKQYEADLKLLQKKKEIWKAKCKVQENLSKSFKAECIKHNNTLNWPKVLQNKWEVQFNNTGLSSEIINIISGTKVIKSEKSCSFIVNRMPWCHKPKTRYIKCPLCGYKHYIPNIY